MAIAAGFCVNLSAQVFPIRYFPQTQPPINTNYFNCEFQNITKTSDNGFIIAYYPYAPNIHGPYPYDFITVKLDSNYISQWKKQVYAKSIKLATGGIIMVYYANLNSSGNGTYIEKVDNGGNQIWIKKINTDVTLNDVISYSNKIRVVGSKDVYNPFWNSFTSTPLTLELDTLGNLISANELPVSNTSTESISKIYRNNFGDFFITGLNGLSISKFNSAFLPIWSMTWGTGNMAPKINDLHFLSNGDLLCSGSVYNLNTSFHSGAFFKFNSVGNLISSKYFDKNVFMSTMEKTSNGNFISSYTRRFAFPYDTVNVFETDSNFNIIYNNNSIKALACGNPKRVKNNLYLFSAYVKDPAIFSVDQNGNNFCGSSADVCTFSNFSSPNSINSISVLSSTVSLSTGTINLFSLQSYYDNCSIVTEIKENYSYDNIFVYPNPTIDYLRIDLPDELVRSEIIEVELLNILGLKVVKKEISPNNKTLQIDVRSLQDGHYFLKLISNGRKINFSRKIIVQR